MFEAAVQTIIRIRFSFPAKNIGMEREKGINTKQETRDVT